MLSIVFRNEHLVVIDKPALVLSVPGRFQDDPRRVAGRELEQQLAVRVWPVHRLDYEVSGLMLFALTAEAHRESNHVFEKRDVEKTYQAFTEKVSSYIQGRQNWRRKILRGKKRSYESPHGEWAETDAEMTNGGSWSEWRLFPRTGKPHQLRLELALQGYPILGDQLYGSKVDWPLAGIALRAISLRFPRLFCEKFQLPETLEVPLLETEGLS